MSKLTATETIDLLGILKNACLSAGFDEGKITEFGKRLDIEISGRDLHKFNKISIELSGTNRVPDLPISTWQTAHILWCVRQGWYQMEIPADNKFATRTISETEAGIICNLYSVAVATQKALDELAAKLGDENGKDN